MSSVRISAVSFRAGPVTSFAGFVEHVTRLVDNAGRERPDFVVFPELFTLELMSMFPEAPLPELFARLSDYTDDYLQLFRCLAQDRGFHIVAGSHFTRAGDAHYNTSHLFTPAGEVIAQRKCNLFPPEKAFGASPGDSLAVVQTEKARVAILICYDLEFPEVARLATLRGAEILFSPSATLGEAGFWRVRHCGQARCVEDQVYVVHSSLLGGPGVHGLEFWGNASILTPCDGAFSAKGIAAEGPFNTEAVVTAEVETELLYEIRERGSAPVLADRRRDLFEELVEAERGNVGWQRALKRS